MRRYVQLFGDFGNIAEGVRGFIAQNPLLSFRSGGHEGYAKDETKGHVAV